MSGLRRRIGPVVRKEFRQIRRDPRTLILLLGVPAFLLVMFGYALNFDVKHIRLVLCDQDQTQASRDFAEAFLRTESFDPAGTADEPDAVDAALDDGRASVGLIIPPGFAADVAVGRRPAVQVLVDGSDPTTGATALGAIEAIALSRSIRLLGRRVERLGLGEVRPLLDLRPRVWYNPELRSVRFLVPGLIAFVLMTVIVISTAFSIVREKERGTMEQILVSP
ncbi:MAG: ABC transporter permease, partial [Candidatus Aminicenantes bacterium]|nr:ABC transporter permease [Candidatus Aminicenantes bacterium]